MSKTKEEKSVHSGHRKRLRDVIDNTDVTVLPEHQVLEMILTYVLPQKDVNPLAHKLLEEFGSIANVFDARKTDLQKIKGVGEVASSFLTFCSKISEVYCKSRANSKCRLTTAKQIINYLRSAISITSVEKFYYLCLNSNGDFQCLNSIGSGSLSELYVGNRELVQDILRYPTHTVVICHTHPYGKLKPSDNDIKFTNQLKNILDSLNIRLCDHIILSPDGYFSFFQNRLLGEELKTSAIGKLKTTMLNSDHFTYAIDENDFPSQDEYRKF